MKKSLLALAALTAFAGAASAQSSVTLFGIVDVCGPLRRERRPAANTSWRTDGNASSRLGFRGVEDLGGGLKAGFWLEGALAAGHRPLTASRRPAMQPDLQRRATVSLMGGLGEIRLGRDYTPTFWNWTVFDPFGTIGVGAATNLGLEVAGLHRAAPTAPWFAPTTPIGYFLPAMGGFYGQIMQSAGENANGNKYHRRPPRLRGRSVQRRRRLGHDAKSRPASTATTGTSPVRGTPASASSPPSTA